ncbi:MAG: hypothetical protein AUJ92_02485 [Armatimonadetes bacterium CG2_30_59_28]|nr:hypothetical protein [Armatimonadota bacterium]OIO97953.1 MAG: hypothetical protein AUJ92_02485 [Armatimonadetes bacterium CG2_30_59_28]PIU63545.1 MAG: hypothetical protein COS85_15695 [Armatimonadetes bacterium CG07_land_8_20_14_0_80_59_28]PIX40555.1 MAG: hypothetical protein COZ56_14480 [Armatimonadetes bacterium CG_4_8_14_3_um_filter_58_9]PJB70579.1 MAG: hypothetical protein CO095_08895 [Armatimonadetes bacterium CG_4_9_14_3_um_filter_58_7]
MRHASESEVSNMIGPNELQKTVGISSYEHSGSSTSAGNGSDRLLQVGPIDSYWQCSRGLGKLPLLTREEEVELAIRVERNDGDARERLVESYLMLVVRIAERDRGCGVPMEYLIQEAALSLARAVRSFDYRQGSRLTAWAAVEIEKDIVQRVCEIWTTTAARCLQRSEPVAPTGCEAGIHHRKDVKWDLLMSSQFPPLPTRRDPVGAI